MDDVRRVRREAEVVVSGLELLVRSEEVSLYIISPSYSRIVSLKTCYDE
jgi:hypothetical protein